MYTNKNILVIGNPCSGKTTYMYNFPNHHHVHTDDYIEYGFERSIDFLLRDIQWTEEPHVVEGVQGYRLLKEGVLRGNYFPDIVIELQVPEELMIKRYLSRSPSALPKLFSFIKGNQTILNSYKQLDNPHPPEWKIITQT